eukprot:CAMPEP_0171310280 /NCGR_PEP_ID=MMETSP0816-20121228/20484_1 /TAXON_ID=420281 /ORGANISM="Proboscia inermis, Strain CCAP1064/1" /LENGTH=109 /DNA_ID=CAMNT_0011794331 /DNA_START=73 /DNA_END=402 /DNA_ORIENTATION=+
MAMSTFFMEDEHGRDTGFQQLGDDEKTIKIAIDKNIVDCMHCIPYKEFIQFEIERQDQKIYFKARIINKRSGGYADSSGGGKAFAVAQQVLSALGFGVIENTEFKLEDK